MGTCASFCHNPSTRRALQKSLGKFVYSRVYSYSAFPLRKPLVNPFQRRRRALGVMRTCEHRYSGPLPLDVLVARAGLEKPSISMKKIDILGTKAFRNGAY